MTNLHHARRRHGQTWLWISLLPTIGGVVAWYALVGQQGAGAAFICWGVALAMATTGLRNVISARDPPAPARRDPSLVFVVPGLVLATLLIFVGYLLLSGAILVSVAV